MIDPPVLLAKPANRFRYALGRLAESVLFLCLVPAILILAVFDAAQRPRPAQRLLEEKRHHA